VKNNMTTFTNAEFGEIRTALINGEPWFVGKDVAEILGYGNTRDALAIHVDVEDKAVIHKSEIATLEIPNRGLMMINESGLYSLILSSKLPTAKKFKRWVTSEVLPAIRKTGSYQEPLTGEELMARALVEAKNVLNDLKIKNSELTVENQIMKPKSDYFDELVDRNLLTNLTDTAKELGIKRKVLINFCLENRYLYRAQKKGTLMPYQKHVQEGLFELKECFNEKSTWKGLQTMVTPKGRETFRLILGKEEH
jgi:prophage antirepressor-like protein